MRMLLKLSFDAVPLCIEARYTDAIHQVFCVHHGTAVNVSEARV